MNLSSSKKICELVSLILSFVLIFSLTACSRNGKTTASAKTQIAKKEPVKLSEGETAIYISPDGSDKNDGSFKSPYKTFAAAQKQLRDINDTMEGNIYIIFREGVYKDELTLYQSDSGENGYDVVIKSYPGEKVEIFGGKNVSGFEKVKGEKYYKTVLKDTESVRQFYVNGTPQPRSTSVTRVLPSDWLNGTDAKDGFLIKTEYLQGVKNASGLELRLIYEWKDIIIPVKGVRKCSDTLSCIYMEDIPKRLYAAMTESSGEFSSGLTLEFFLENSVDLIDEPGEWAFDKSTGEFYYYPAKDVDMANAVFEIPERGDLLTIEGFDGNTKAHNIVVEGLIFRIGAWDVPTESGFISWQADAYWEGVTVYPNVKYNQMTGNVHIKNCDSILFKGNTFTGMGATALTASEGVSNSQIIGNTFTNCASGALTVGNYKQNKSLHTDVENQLCDNIIISDNSVYKVGQSYYSVIGLQVYHGRNITLTHNDIINTPDSGISIGWGWDHELITTTENIKVTHNKILFHSMQTRDSGGIYTLGRQKNCVIEDNYIKDNGYTMKGIYHDSSTGGYIDSRNVLDMKQSSYWTNDYHENTLSMTYNDNYTSTLRHMNYINSVHNNTTYVLDRNWPLKAKNIIMNAGVTTSMGVARATAFGIPSQSLSLWLASDNGVEFDQGGKVSTWKDYSGKANDAQIKSGTVEWSGYASNENHALNFSKNSSLEIKEFDVADAFTVAFVASFGEADDLNSLLKTVGLTMNKKPDSTDGLLIGDSISGYVYSTDGKKGVLYQNGTVVAEWKSGAPNIKNSLIVGNNEASLYEIMYFNTQLTDSELNAILDHFKGKYTLTGPTQESLLLWLDAAELVTADENGLVSSWGDNSPRRLGGLIQGNTEYMPKLVSDGINGKPSILFDGKDDKLYNFSTRWVGEEVTMFVVADLKQADTQSFGSVAGIKEFLTEIKADGSIVTGDNIPDRVTSPAGSFSFGKPQLITYQRYPLFEEIKPTDEVWLSVLPGVIRLWNGDEKIGEYRHYTSQGDAEWSGFALGSNDSTTLNGKISEILVYDRLLTDNERENIVEYLKLKYGLT